jgi:hypothetical protein
MGAAESGRGDAHMVASVPVTGRFCISSHISGLPILGA